MVKAKKYQSTNQSEQAKMVCRVCLGDHPLRFCDQFLDLSLEDRLRVVSLYKHCSGCLSHDHTWRTCESQGKCRQCGDSHHTLLCEQEPLRNRVASSVRGPRSSRNDRQRGPRSSQATSNRRPRSSQDSHKRRPRSSQGADSRRPRSSRDQGQGGRPSTAVVRRDAGTSQNARLSRRQPRSPVRQANNMALVPRRESRVQHREVATMPMEIDIFLPVGDSILLKPTAVVKVVGEERYFYKRALLDPNSSFSIISEDLVHELKLKMFRVGDIMMCELFLKGRYGDQSRLKVRPVVKRSHRVITPTRSLDPRIKEEFPGYQLSDTHFYESGPVELTLGGEVYWSAVRKGMQGGTVGRPVATFSIFGYIISGVCSA